MGSASAFWVRQQLGLAEQVPLSTAGANKAGNVGRRPTLHILPRCTRPSSDDRRPIEGRSKADFSALKLDRSPTGCRSRPHGKPISIRFREKPHSTPTQHPLDTQSTLTQHPLDTHSTLTQHPLDTHSAPVTLQPKCSIATGQDMRCTCTGKPAQSQRPALACTCGAHG